MKVFDWIRETLLQKAPMPAKYLVLETAEEFQDEIREVLRMMIDQGELRIGKSLDIEHARTD